MSVPVAPPKDADHDDGHLLVPTMSAGLLIMWPDDRGWDDDDD